MLLRHSFSRLPSPPSWISRFPSPAMPLRAKVTNPAFQTASLSTSANIPKELPGDEPDDVLFNSLYGLRNIELNRPKKLNSLNGSMVRKIFPRLKEWEKSHLASMVLISGAGSKALCAGGDVAALALQNEQGPDGQRASTDFFGLEYRLDHSIATYSKPVISFMDGITMGGGVGLSLHAPFRIATEKTVFAMPETTIGFFPDVGGSFFLPRLDGNLGVYLALTSERVNGVQALYTGIATHYIHSSVLSNLTQRLSELVFPDRLDYEGRLDAVNKTMSEFSLGLPSLKEEPMVFSGSLRSAIDRCFQFKDLEEIFEHLEKEEVEKEWAQKTLETLKSRSPLSLKVTLRAMKLGQEWSIAETFQREHAIAGHFMRHPDFVEGVKARLMSKPPRQAQWQSASIEEVQHEHTDPFFITPEDQPALELDTTNDYHDYSHRRFALPRDQDVEAVFRKNLNREKTLEHFISLSNQKEGVVDKVTEILNRRVRTATQPDQTQVLEWIESF